jgi:hypothetical protein
MNGFPAIQFDDVSGATNNDELNGVDAANLDSTAGITIFTVSQPQHLTGSARAIISKRIVVDNNESYMMFYYTGNNFYTDVDASLNRFHSTALFSPNTNYLIDLVYDGTLIATHRSKLYIGGGFHMDAGETSASIPDYASPFSIGSTNANDGRPFGGYIAEVIVFRKALNDAERIIVDNYLSAKYNLAMAASDHYLGDTPANGDYDYEMAGVGNEASGINAAAASSVSGGLALAQVAGFEASDYLMYGHQAGVNWLNVTDVSGMTGSNNAGASETVDLTFDMSDGGMAIVPASVSNYKLLYRAGLSGAWSEIATATSIAGDRILFSNVLASSTGYYTIGTWENTISPLPIELLRFHATAFDKKVKLEWTTATETGNHFFSVERTDAMNTATTILTIPGSGTTTTQHIYEAFDEHPLQGTSYYRLRQTDFNGQSTVAGWEAVEFSNCNELSVYPNPCTAHCLRFNFCESRANAVIKLYDQSGRVLHDGYFTAIEAGKELTWNIPEEILAGVYFLHIQSGEMTWTKTVIIQ